MCGVGLDRRVGGGGLGGKNKADEGKWTPSLQYSCFFGPNSKSGVLFPGLTSERPVSIENHEFESFFFNI